MARESFRRLGNPWLVALILATLAANAPAQDWGNPQFDDGPGLSGEQPSWPQMSQGPMNHGPMNQGPDFCTAAPTCDPFCDHNFCDPNDYQQVTDIPLSLSIPCLQPGWDLHAGVLLLQPHSDDLGYAVVTFEENYSSPVPIATPYWQIEFLEPEHEPGFEVGGRYALAKPGTDFQFNWQRLRTETSDGIPPKQATGQWVSPFSQTGPPTAETYQELQTDQGVNDLHFADGHVWFDYDEVNLDFGQQVNIGSSLALRLLAGLSYARLQETLISNFHGRPPAPNAPYPLSVPLLISLNNSATYSGVGPRFGLDTALDIPHGFRLTAQLAGALLVGRKQPAQYLFSATGPDLAAIGIDVNRESITSPSSIEVVSSYEAKLGIGFSRTLRRGGIFTLDAGYMAAFYSNPFAGYATNDNILALQIGSLSTASMRQTQSDFTLNGAYLTGGYKW